MRGGLDGHTMLCDTDLEDLEIVSNIVLENIEAVKKTGMPIL